ncbi:Transposon TX1 uncharacterized protein [Nymphaea thermarum]|nr:Transposon TX1 uncharacterized protein [Nymphaea thermarum]
MVFLGDDILPALSAHFRDFYSKPLRFRATLPDFHLSSLSVYCASALERPFQHQEIKNAVWALGSGKAPGIDGFPVEFFRTFWEVCSADVFAFCDELAYNSVFLKEINQATCVLVPKRSNPTDVTHFRPISIIGTPYKIIAKLLSLRLAPVMPSVINPFQVAFVKGRRLHDAVVIANEVVHSLYCLRLPSFILKLDISKAFDSVSWEFLSDLLTRLAFGPSFRQWSMSLVTGAQLAVSFNGKCGDFFRLERGLRQGCTLSPLLFNLVAESFSVLFHHATVVGFLTPHSLSHLPSFSTIQYADDFLLFGSASRQQIVRTWFILRVFELISSHSINPFQVAFVKVDHSLVTGAQLAVSFNGKCGDFFCLERGLRQGCPLSPLLFNLVAENFSAFFHHATVVGFLTPHSLSHLPSFSTVQYADDFLMFDSPSRQQILRTWLILRVFELISGHSINSTKCHLSLIHAIPATVLLAEACFGCKATGQPMDYWGIQITLSSPAPSFWDGVEQKLTDRLQCWQRKLLSLPGQITQAKHCLASVSLHALSVFRPPAAVLRRFDKLIRKFVWDEDRPSDRLAH